MYQWKPLFPYWFFCVDDLSIDVSQLLKFSTTILLVSFFMNINSFFLYLSTHILGD